MPLVAFKIDEREMPLISRVKSLQDGINQMHSNLMNNMEEDPHNTILVIENYDGTDLGEFQRNLATYGANLTELDKITVNALDSAIEKMPQYTGTVYRDVEFMSPDIYREHLQEIIAEKQVVFEAYTSTTTLPTYSEKPHIRYVIKTHTGADLRSINVEEQEILIKRNTKFTVSKCYPDKEAGYVLVEMEEIEC